MPTIVRSRAKINLGLGIGGPRKDGFHSLTTVYQTLEAHDLVTVTAKRTGSASLHVTCDDPRVPVDQRNTAWKMAHLVLEELAIPAEVHIHIDKRLPIQGGLGAGSANAVAALVGLELELRSRPQAGDEPQICGVPSTFLSPTRGLALAAQVGSDVPLFLIGGTILGLDRGQEVYPLPDLDPVWCLIAAPSTGVSTPQAFAAWDSLCQGLTEAASTDKLMELSRAYASAFAGWDQNGSSGVLSSGEDLAGPAGAALVRTGIMSWMQNDFERVVFPQQPILCDIKRLLAASGTPEAALHASLSGSGSALFGLYRNRQDAEAAQARIETGISGVKVDCTVTRTLPRAAYWKGMIVQEVS
jgi:4-diphosphocytidyl-2-C-methyl-D-erythritol kinase